MKPLANRVPCFYQKLFVIKQAKKLNERLRISATKNKNTILHVYNSKIGGSEERLFETRVDPGKMHESNLPTIEVMSFKNMSNDDD